MKSADEDKDDNYKYEWDIISGADKYHQEMKALGLLKEDQTEREQIEFWYFKNYNNYVSIRKMQTNRVIYISISLFLFWVLFSIYQPWKGSTAGFPKGWWEFFVILFYAVVVLSPILTGVSICLLDYFFACCVPHHQRIRVWQKYGISCPKCFKLAEPKNKSRNKYICHNPDCDMQEFANIAHNVSRAY